MPALIVTKGRAKYKIDRDPNQFTLEKYSKGKDKTGADIDIWTNIGYYSDLQYLIRKLIFLHVMDKSTLGDIVKAMDTTCKTLSEQVKIALTRGEA